MPFALSLFTPPTADPVSLIEAKQHCRISLADDDTLLLTYLQAAREHVEVETQRQLLPATWILGLDQFPCLCEVGDGRIRGWWGEPYILMPRAPLQSVTSLTYVDTAGSTQTLANTVYGVDTLSEPGRVYLKAGQSWPGTLSQPNAVQIKYIAGYANASRVPAMLKQAILLLVAAMYEYREHLADKAVMCVPGLQALLWNNRVEVL